MRKFRKLVTWGLLGILVVVMVFQSPIVFRWIRFQISGNVDFDNGLTLYLDPTDKIITFKVISTGEYVPLEMAMIKEHLQPGMTFIDIGANIGIYTLVAAREVGDKGRVFAFDPDPTSYHFLLKNVEANGFKNVTVEQKALSNEVGKLQLFIAEKNKGDHRIYDVKGENRKAIDVEALPLDLYLKDDAGSVDLIKVDTQGAEGLIWQGMRQTLVKHPRVAVSMEYDPNQIRECGGDPLALLQDAVKLGFIIQAEDEGIADVTIVPPEKLEQFTKVLTESDAYVNLFLSRPKDWTPSADLLESLQPPPAAVEPTVEATSTEDSGPAKTP